MFSSVSQHHLLRASCQTLFKMACFTLLSLYNLNCVAGLSSDLCIQLPLAFAPPCLISTSWLLSGWWGLSWHIICSLKCLLWLLYLHRLWMTCYDSVFVSGFTWLYTTMITCGASGHQLCCRNLSNAKNIVKAMKHFWGNKSQQSKSFVNNPTFIIVLWETAWGRISVMTMGSFHELT